MNDSGKPTPFGILFEEVAPSPQAMPTPMYDEKAGLSYITDPTGGTPIPFVEATFSVPTQTFTAVHAEDSDSDQDPAAPPVLTATATKVYAEGTDNDSAIEPGQFMSKLETQTFTEVRTESTDSDKSLHLALEGTETFTRIREERTDSD